MRHEGEMEAIPRYDTAMITILALVSGGAKSAAPERHQGEIP